MKRLSVFRVGGSGLGDERDVGCRGLGWGIKGLRG